VPTGTRGARATDVRANGTGGPPVGSDSSMARVWLAGTRRAVISAEKKTNFISIQKNNDGLHKIR
jgi:hypothetical protein